MQNLIDALSRVVKNAGKIMLGVSGVDSGEEICEKSGDANYVTVFDVKVQNYLINEIKAILPDAVFMAEEKENDPEVLQCEHCFIIDPIDGTTNFIRNYKQSSISVAMVSRGEVVLGIVYNPYLDELFYAVAGGGAFMNGEKISVLTGGRVDRMDIITESDGIRRLRILDYKTGSHEESASKLENLFAHSSKHAGYYLQTFLYAIVTKHSNLTQLPIKPVLFYTAHAGKADYDPTLCIGSEESLSSKNS